MKKRLVFDIECYKDYFLASFKLVGAEKFAEFEQYDGHPLDTKEIRRIMREYEIIGFNIISYDLPVLCAALGGWSCSQLKRLSDEIITSGKPSWLICRNIGIKVPREWDHIDLIDVAFGQASLKIYGGRLHSRLLQDLPIDPSSSISPPQRAQLLKYCRNDLYTTEDLLNALAMPLQLRQSIGEQYGLQVMSKSDAQIAEAILKSELEKSGISAVKNANPPTQFRYRAPDFIQFESQEFRALLESVHAAEFVVKDTGQVQMPKTLGGAIPFDGAKYSLGIGGLHSQEKNQSVVCGDGEMLFDADFASYYPFIILGENLYPLHLGKGFLDVYGSIVARRIAAKNRCGEIYKTLDAGGLCDKERGELLSELGYQTNTMNTLKTSINGSFGKLGSKYSYLYSPDLLIKTTVTGQLCLLMLIEMVTANGASVVSANTDGIVIKCWADDYNAIAAAMYEFELLSGYTLEETHYKAIHSASVNNYVAVTTGGKVKGKGQFAIGGMSKNPTNVICTKAVYEYVKTGKPVEETIKDCSDVRDFVSVRAVTGGAVWRGEELGKAVRFYYSTDGESIHYKKNGNKVPKSDGAKPLMNLPDSLPKDLDFDWYIAEANKMIGELGC